MSAVLEFTDLATELVVYIFQYLNLKDLKTCGATCSWFRQIIFGLQPAFVRQIADLPDDVNQERKYESTVRTKALLDCITNHLLGEESQLLIVEMIGNLGSVYNQVNLIYPFLRRNIISELVQTELFQLAFRSTEFLFRNIVSHSIENQRLTQSSIDLALELLPKCCNIKERAINNLIQRQRLTSAQQVQIITYSFSQEFLGNYDYNNRYVIKMHNNLIWTNLVDMFRYQILEYQTLVTIFQMLRTRPHFTKIDRAKLITKILCVHNQTSKREIMKAYSQAKLN